MKNYLGRCGALIISRMFSACLGIQVDQATWERREAVEGNIIVCLPFPKLLD
jgi:hypothetical protein